jgi:hypothetical protein
LMKVAVSSLKVFIDSAQLYADTLSTWINQYQNIFCFAATALVVIVDAVCDAISVASDSNFAYGFYTLYIGVTLLISLGILSAVIFRFVKTRNAVTKAGYCKILFHPNVRKIRNTILGLAVVDAAIIIIAFKDIFEPIKFSEDQGTLDPSTPNFSLWMTAAILTQFINLQLSWLPLCARQQAVHYDHKTDHSSPKAGTTNSAGTVQAVQQT